MLFEFHKDCNPAIGTKNNCVVYRIVLVFNKCQKWFYMFKSGYCDFIFTVTDQEDQ